MKIFIEKIIKLRNPTFTFDTNLTNYSLFQFLYLQVVSIIRGLKAIAYLKNPKGLLLGKNVHFFNIPAIKWGKYLKIGDNVYISALGQNGITFGNNVGIGAYSRIIVSTSLNNLGKYITIGNNVGIGEFAYLGGAGGLEIGDDCIIGQYLSCHPENHNFSKTNELIRLQGTTRKGIKIGSNCWIGSKVTVLDGVTIGDNCVIAAGSVITKSLPPNCVIGGVPAKVIKSIEPILKVA